MYGYREGFKYKVEDMINTAGRVLMVIGGVWAIGFVASLIFAMFTAVNGEIYLSNWWLGCFPVFGVGLCMHDSGMIGDFWKWIRHG